MKEGVADKHYFPLAVPVSVMSLIYTVHVFSFYLRISNAGKTHRFGPTEVCKFTNFHDNFD